jgi:uncharacterized membrane-anchored protein YhcB (DUF1043 family)
MWITFAYHLHIHKLSLFVVVLVLALLQGLITLFALCVSILSLPDEHIAKRRKFTVVSWVSAVLLFLITVYAGFLNDRLLEESDNQSNNVLSGISGIKNQLDRMKESSAKLNTVVDSIGDRKATPAEALRVRELASDLQKQIGEVAVKMNNLTGQKSESASTSPGVTTAPSSAAPTASGGSSLPCGTPNAQALRPPLTNRQNIDLSKQQTEQTGIINDPQATPAARIAAINTFCDLTTSGVEMFVSPDLLIVSNLRHSSDQALAVSARGLYVARNYDDRIANDLRSAHAEARQRGVNVLRGMTKDDAESVLQKLTKSDLKKYNLQSIKSEIDNRAN